MRILASVILVLLLLAFTHAGKGRKPNKTIRDSVFVAGDIIAIPAVNFLPSPDYGKMNTHTKDSLSLVGDFLLAHPNLTVDLVNHTDYLGSFAYNNQMSQERARVCVKYLVTEKHVPPNRIRAKAAGEYFLLKDENDIKNAQSKEEKEALHQMNVRTELQVMKVDL